MNVNFPACLAFVLAEEGGFVDNPDDPGGATNAGITLETFQDWHDGATVEALKNISHAEIEGIYFDQYWTSVAGDKLPAGLDLMVFDHGVTAGPRRSALLLQRLLGVTQDSHIGPLTIAAIGARSITELIAQLSGVQKAFYRSRPGFSEFGDGWIARLERRTKAALAMTGPQQPKETT